MKKYEFTGKTKEYCGVILKQIRRIEDNLIGGWIESEENLSQEGLCFVFDNAIVYNKAQVFNNAKVYDNARIYDDARISGNAEVFDNAQIYGNAVVSGNATICDNTKVFENAKISDNAGIWNDAEIYGDAKVSDDARIHDQARVCSNVEVSDDARVYNDMIINCKFKDFHYYSFFKGKPITALLCEDDIWRFNIGCQDLLTKDEFIQRIEEEDGGLKENPHRKKYLRILNIY